MRFEVRPHLYASGGRCVGGFLTSDRSYFCDRIPHELLKDMLLLVFFTLYK
ncbi:MAG: hypothetical protein HXY43_03165 [Fischerella sp.]|uniref:hypothetical protein n=1 Tax=Fischerella sp. TaxID=1191 RepID=UPI0018380624|nr:hypothetical protein [Fischerella sp.]NWF58328.1 hypothetical protein [Fischerella sp.]